MPQNRQQVGDLPAPEQLQPRASPVQSVVDPGAATGPLTDLFNGLGQLSPTLDRMAQSRADEDRIAHEAAAERKIGGMTYEEAKAAVKDGSLHEFQNPFFRASFEKSFGIRAEDEVRRQAEEELAAADFTTADPEAYVAGKVKAAQADIPPGKFAAAGFQQATAGLLDKVRDKVNGDRIQRTVQDRSELATSAFNSTIERGVAAGQSPSEIVVGLRTLQQQYRDTQGLTYGDSDALLGKVLQTIAQRPGMEALVAEMGGLDRGGVRLSARLGPTFETAKETAHAATLRADNEEVQKTIAPWIIAADSGDPTKFDLSAWHDYVEAHPAVKGQTSASIELRFTNAQDAARREALRQVDEGFHEHALVAAEPRLADLAMQGHIAEVAQDQEVSKPSGNGTVTLTAAEMKERGLQAAQRQIEAAGAAQHKDPQAIRGETISMWARNGEIEPLLNSQTGAFLNATAMPGDPPQTALDYLPTIQLAQKVAPHVLDRIASSDKDRLFLHSLQTGMEFGLAPAEALKNAAWRRDNADALSPMSTRDRAALSKGVMDKLDGQGGFLLWGHNKVQNTAAVSHLVDQQLDYFYATGASGPDLQKRVVDNMARTHVYLNGQLVDVTGTGMSAPQAAPILAEAAHAAVEANPSWSKLGGVTYIPVAPHSDVFRVVTADGTARPGHDKTWAELQQLYHDRRNAALTARGNEALKNGPTPLAVAGQALGEGAAPILKDAGQAYSTAAHHLMEGVRSLPKVEVTDNSAQAASGLPGFRER